MERSNCHRQNLRVSIVILPKRIGRDNSSFLNYSELYINTLLSPILFTAEIDEVVNKNGNYLETYKTNLKIQQIGYKSPHVKMEHSEIHIIHKSRGWIS